MSKTNIITPNNLGKTIKYEALASKKWDVLIDGDQFELSVNGIYLKDSVLKPLKDNDITEATVQGTTLKLKKVNGEFIEISLVDLVPAQAKDLYLQNVSYQANQKQLVFTVGDGVNPDNNLTYNVDVRDLLPVVSGNGLKGNGTSNDPLRIKTPEGSNLSVTENGIEFDKTGFIELVDAFDDVHLSWFFPSVKARCEQEYASIDPYFPTPLGNVDGDVIYAIIEPYVTDQSDYGYLGNGTVPANWKRKIVEGYWSVTITADVDGHSVTKTDKVIKPAGEYYLKGTLFGKDVSSIKLNPTDNFNDVGGSVSWTFRELFGSDNVQNIRMTCEMVVGDLHIDPNNNQYPEECVRWRDIYDSQLTHNMIG